MWTKGPGSVEQQSSSRKSTAGAKGTKAAKVQHTQHRQAGADKPRSDDLPATGPKGPIAMLQEFVQCSKAFPLPPNYSALQWAYDTRMATKAALEYRATVSFYLEGVPHHAAGTWHPAKKDAQRDAADRALRLFVGRWSAELLRFQPDDDACLEGPCESEGNSEATDEERLLECFCAQVPAITGPINWNIEHKCSDDQDREQETRQCFAVVELHLLGVPHKLAGAPKDSESEARTDAARRALWYLQCPGFESAFEPERLVSSKGPKEDMAAPPQDWLHDESSQEAIAEANRKTIVMKTQNRLQQAFSRQLKAGVGVWEWTYETDPNDTEWPPLFRATVSIPVLQRKFDGNWVRGQRDAQIEAIGRVNAFLDEDGSNRPH